MRTPPKEMGILMSAPMVRVRLGRAIHVWTREEARGVIQRIEAALAASDGGEGAAEERA